MTVYVDNMRRRADVPNGARVVRGRWSHMVADTHEELVEMADKLGLKQTWIQCEGTWKEHFDVTETKRAAAFKLGAVELIIGSEWKAFMDKKRLTDPVFVARRAAKVAAAAAELTASTADDLCPTCNTRMDYVGSPDGNSGGLHCWPCWDANPDTTTDRDGRVYEFPPPIE
jgi:hypothetical protein